MQAAELSTDTRHENQSCGGFAVPKPPQYSAPRWVPKGEVIRAGGLEIGGMVYFGAPPAGGSGAELSLIDPTLQVAAVGDFFRVSLALRASYKALTPAERRGYLTCCSPRVAITRTPTPGWCSSTSTASRDGSRSTSTKAGARRRRFLRCWKNWLGFATSTARASRRWPPRCKA